MPQAISYMRFSALHQGKGSTLKRQEALVNSWLDEHPDISLSPISATDKGLSGYTGAHLEKGALGAIVKAIELNKIHQEDYLLIEAVDRLGRLPPLEMFSLIKRIVDSGIIIVTLEDRLEYSKSSLEGTDSGIFILVGKVQQAHDYSKRLSFRISQAYKNKREAAKQGKRIKRSNPIWLDSSGKLNSESAPMILDCINLFLKGYGTRKTILELKDKYPYLTKTHPTTLKRWFENKAIIGHWETKGELIENVFEPLIDTTTFYKLRAEIQSRKKQSSPPDTYILSGLIKCGTCKKRFNFRRKKHKNGVILYANCSTYLKRGKEFCNNNKTWPYEVLLHIYEESYLEALNKLAISQNIEEHVQELETLKLELTDINGRIDNLLRLVTSAVIAQNLESQLAEEANRKELLQNNIKEIERKIDSSSNAVTSGVIEVNEKLLALDENSVETRDILAKRGYRLEITLDEANVNTQYHEGHTFKLIQRSTKHNGYFLEHHRPSNDSSSNRIDKYLIGKNGAVACNKEEISWEEFSNDFETQANNMVLEYMG